MIDNYEKFIKNITQRLVDSTVDIEDVPEIVRLLSIELKNWTLDKICTQVVVRDNSIDEVVKMYCGTLLSEGKAQSTVYGYGRLLLRFLYDVGKLVQDIGVFDIRVWLALRQQEVSMRTAENYRAYLSAFFIWMTKEGVIDTNPMARIKPIRYIDEVRYPYSDVELDKLRSACSTLRQRAMLEVLISSGIRVSELSNMNKSDLDFNSLELLVRRGKGGKQRVTYINDVAKEHLTKYLASRTDDLPYLFTTRINTRYSKAAVEDDLKAIGRAAGVDNVHPHRCRRTFATTSARKGMDLITIQLLMGHSNLDTTKGYITLDTDYIKNQYKRING